MKRSGITLEAYEAMQARVAAGEPEPGTWTCASCNSSDGVRNYLRPSTPERGGLEYFLVCPCCSFRPESGCPHVRIANCITCGRPAEPAGSLPGGGPYVRCAVDGAHDAAADDARLRTRIAERHAAELIEMGWARP